MRIALGVMIVGMGVAPACTAAGSPSPKADAAHKQGICGEIKKLDLLLYDDPSLHGPTATCSYTDERLLIKPNKELPDVRMKRFVFLAFLSTGRLRNEDFRLPEKVFVGYGAQCQWMTTNDTALLQSDVRTSKGQAGMASGYMVAMSAPKVICPK